jgi:lambda repressor-like predicted transcriptional regulator
MNHAATNRCNDMAPTEIKIAMLRAGVSQKGIAQSLDPPVSRQAVHLVVNCKATSHRIRAAIARAVGIDLVRIWPSAYLGDCGRRKQDQIPLFNDE